jgi:DNA-binding NtrC family response regulator
MPKKPKPRSGEGLILIVDSEKPIRESLEDLLIACGFTPISAKSYKDAVAALEKSSEEPEAILCELNMTGKSGLELLRYINKNKKDIPLIFFTGYGTLESCQEAVRENAFDYILKPIDNKDKIVFPLKHAVKRYRLEKKNREMQADIIRMAKEHKRIVAEILDDAEIRENIQGRISKIVDRWE